jgi:uncharacterized membrane protein
MPPLKRKILYAVSFEVLGILVSGLFLRLFSGADAAHSFSLSAFAATIAMVWSYGFNSVFEFWESRQTQRGRSPLRRAVHALLFEVGLLIVLLPLTAWWLAVTLWQALLLEAGIVVVFVVYTFLFTLAFDRIFGLPAATR